jgi:hypothetical protein
MARPQDTYLKWDLANAEATYGAGVTPATWFKLTGAGLFQREFEFDDDMKEITGHPYVSDGGAKVIRRSVSGSLEYKVNVDLLTYLVASICGGVTTTGSGPYTHTVKWPGSGVVSPKTFSVIQASDRNSTASMFEYNGIYPNSVGFTVDQPGAILGTVELQGDGSQVATAGDSVPAIDSDTGGNRLYQEQAVIKLGPSSQVVTTIFRSMSATWTADVQQRVLPSTAPLVGEIEYGEDAPSLEVALTVKGQKGDTVWGYFNSETKVVFDITITDGTNSIQLVLSSARVMALEEAFDGIDHVLNMTLRSEYNATDASPWKFIGVNSVSAYLA